MVLYTLGGVLLLALGGICLIYPFIGVSIIMYAIFILIFTMGLLHIVRWIWSKLHGVSRPVGVLVVDGLINFIIGSAMLAVNIDSKISIASQYVFVFRIAIVWLLLWGVCRLVAILFAEKAEYENKIIPVIFSLVAIIFGIILFMGARHYMPWVVRVLGIAAICLGCLNISDSITIMVTKYVKNKKFKK